MTAEIVIINSQGIALAADSAVTIGRNRVWKTANKLFSLGPVNDIAIMIYNVGDFVGIPWEVVIKGFRESVGRKEFVTLKECERDFFEYLNDEIYSINQSSDYSMISAIISFVDRLVLHLNYKSLTQLQHQLTSILPEALEEVSKTSKLIDVIPFNIFKKRFKNDIAVICKDAFGFRLTKPFLDQVIDLLYELVSRQVPSVFMSGIVFAGYGKTQLMPCLTSYIIDGRMQYREGKTDVRQTRFWLDKQRDLSELDTSEAYVYPFAQADIFYLFMEGILPRYLAFISKTLKSVLDNKSSDLIKNFVPPESQQVEQVLQNAENEEAISTFNKVFSEYRSETLVAPVLEVISALPKEEMAAMAEALVELTALRRKVGSNLESVGGPTDVAVISKGEGLIWLKRKHYFDSDLNSDFAVRKRLKLMGNSDA